MLFAKETYVRFRNDGVALCKIGGIILLSGEEKDVPFGNISTMSVANGYKNGVRLIGLVVDGNLSRICDNCCAIEVDVKPSPFEIPTPVVVEVADPVEIEPVVAEEIEVAVVEPEVVEPAPKRGRKPRG